MKITIKKSTLYFILAIPIIFITALLIYFNDDKHNNVTSASALELKFNDLNNANTNLCSGPNYIDFMADDARLQGSCCSAMDFHRYTEQVEGLKKYSNIKKIPSDPYDIEVSLAKELLEYQKNVELTEEQQAIYDEAVKKSHEGGPCCCKCWRWYAFEGLAKYLIAEHNFNAEQIAEVWGLEDGCGGSGHIEHEGGLERETFDPQI